VCVYNQCLCNFVEGALIRMAPDGYSHAQYDALATATPLSGGRWGKLWHPAKLANAGKQSKPPLLPGERTMHSARFANSEDVQARFR
jgi:hypothetical protein